MGGYVSACFNDIPSSAKREPYSGAIERMWDHDGKKFSGGIALV